MGRFVAVGLFVALLAGPSRAAEGESGETNDRRWYAHGLLLGAANPVQVAPLLGFNFKNTYGHSDNVLFDKTYWRVGVEAVAIHVTPALELNAEWMPIAVFKLKAAYQVMVFPGIKDSFGVGLTFPTRDAPTDDATRAARAGEEVSALAHHLRLVPTLQAKVGPVIAVNELEASLWAIAGPDDFYMDPVYDALLTRGRPTLQYANRALVLYEAWTGGGEAKALVGLTHQYVLTTPSQYVRSRLGAAVLYTPVDRWGVLKAPTLFLSPGYHLYDKNRSGTFYVEAVLAVEVG